ncbi:MAG: hypothetical protein BWK77_02565 [Verrucomicrobia bacterium A1]|nr:MAG: hypothetical protein BWK77_02565 [Verrucomicrobia bacterium A1]
MVVGAAAALLLGACPGRAQTSKPAGPTENAALFYWKAAGLMQQPQTQEQLQFARFADNAMRNLPPRVFAAKPDVLRWLLNERSALTALGQAARFKTCAFALRAPGIPGLDVSHLPRLQALMRRALAAAKAYEYADNRDGAASIYASLFTLVANLDQDRNFTSGFTAAELLQELVLEVEGFVSRDPPASAARLLADYFKPVLPNLFHPAGYLLDEARLNSAWLLTAPDRAQDKLSRLYGNTAHRPAVEQLMSLDRVKQEERLRAWVHDYIRQMKALAEATELPFNEAQIQLRELDRQREAMRKDPSGGDNPLIPLLVPALSQGYQRLLLSEAQFDMAEILACAAAFRQGTGTWPARIAEINQYMHRPMAQDPFSGEDFYYRLVKDLPVVAARIPKSLANDSALLYRLELAQRRRKDEERAQAALRQLKEEKERELRQPVPMAP